MRTWIRCSGLTRTQVRVVLQLLGECKHKACSMCACASWTWMNSWRFLRSLLLLALSDTVPSVLEFWCALRPLLRSNSWQLLMFYRKALLGMHQRKGKTLCQAKVKYFHFSNVEGLSFGIGKLVKCVCVILLSSSSPQLQAKSRQNHAWCTWVKSGIMLSMCK